MSHLFNAKKGEGPPTLCGTCTSVAVAGVNFYVSREKAEQDLEKGAQVFSLEPFRKPTYPGLGIRIKELHRQSEPQRFTITERELEVEP